LAESRRQVDVESRLRRHRASRTRNRHGPPAQGLPVRCGSHVPICSGRE
jgi:hypothetical protein